MVVNFELHGKKIMGLNGGPHFKMNPSISFFVNCTSVAETEEKWAKLIEGGKALMPLDKYPWNEKYGWLEDRFGMNWQLSFSGTEAAEKAIRPALLFTGGQFGRAEEAIHFYSTVFKETSNKMVVHYPADSPFSGKLMYSEFSLLQNNFIAMDGPGAHTYSFNEAVSFVIPCHSQQALDDYWAALSDGGEEGQCGWLKDRFDVSWQIVPVQLATLMADPEKAKRVFAAFMTMKKPDIAALENA